VPFRALKALFSIVWSLACGDTRAGGLARDTTGVAPRSATSTVALAVTIAGDEPSSEAVNV